MNFFTELEAARTMEAFERESPWAQRSWVKSLPLLLDDRCEVGDKFRVIVGQHGYTWCAFDGAQGLLIRSTQSPIGVSVRHLLSGWVYLTRDNTLFVVFPVGEPRNGYTIQSTHKSPTVDFSFRSVFLDDTLGLFKRAMGISR